jgi:spermidine synthase
MEEMPAATSEAPETFTSTKNRGLIHWFYGFFFVSGFCSLLYELIWMRLAMAQFGVTATLTATFLSVFMAGLGLGSWAAGRWLRDREGRASISPVLLYALTELTIGIFSILVPHELRGERELLLRLGANAGWTSFRFSCLSGMWLALSLIPPCACMGATFPFAISALSRAGKEQQRSFSYLYLANVLGAMVGVTLPLLLVEGLGFHRTLRIGGLLNLGIAACAAIVFKFHKLPSNYAAERNRGIKPGKPLSRPNKAIRWFLFSIGAGSMAMEVVWVRIFTPYLGTVIYAFAGILGVYLIATFVGGKLYRRGFLNVSPAMIWFALGSAGLLPIVAADPTLLIPRLLRLPLGVFLPALVAGFATPMLVDLESGGDAAIAGAAYAANVLGCIVGPLIAGFLLLPYVSERWTIVILAAPWIVASGFAQNSSSTKFRRRWQAIMLAMAACALAFVCRSFEGQFTTRRVLRDSTATVIAIGQTRSNKMLLVNGLGMSRLTPITKFMAHLPLAFANSPRKILVVCFGLGTTHRSALSWGIESTAVELTPSVPRMFSYFHADAETVLASPRSRVVIDDGRRFLQRSAEQYDVITIDPPPPVEAAGSSLLYSKEFYDAAKRRLRPGGILQQWMPGGDEQTFTAIARALMESFPYVRAFKSCEGTGAHFLASLTPLPEKTASQLANQLPPKAIADLLEWGPQTTAEEQFDVILNQEIPLAQILAKSRHTTALDDDHPVNEYFLMRRLLR